jgi:hypothetical protein
MWFMHHVVGWESSMVLALLLAASGGICTTWITSSNKQQ